MYQGFFRDLQSIMGKLDYRTLRENVADEIRMKILNGDMKPGDKIIEQELASEFGISRGPVREALRQLEQEGMVEYPVMPLLLPGHPYLPLLRFP